MQVVRLDPALDSLIAPGVQPERVATGFQFTEGPLWRHGRLWFVDQTGNTVFAMTPDGKLTPLIDRSSGFRDLPAPVGPNGMAPDKDGSVVMCEQNGRAVVRLVGPDDALEVKSLLQAYDGKRLNSPNDIVFAKDGSFYFTDPPYGLKQRDQDPAKELPFNAVYHYAHGRLTAIIRDLPLPNGINFSPDGKTMYVANSGPHRMILHYPVRRDGTVGPASLLIDFPHPEDNAVPDGLKIDARGNIWATGPGGIRVIQPDGKVLGQIKLPETASNLAWGNDGTVLYITARHSIYRLPTRVQGKLPLYAR